MVLCLTAMTSCARRPTHRRTTRLTEALRQAPPPGFELATVPVGRFTPGIIRGAQLPAFGRAPFRVLLLALGVCAALAGLVLGLTGWAAAGVYGPLVAAGLALVLGSQVTRHRIEVGCDGALLRGMDRHRFLPIAKIEHAATDLRELHDATYHLVHIDLRAGRSLEFRIDDGYAASRIVARLEHARAVGAAVAAEPLEARLGAAGRGPEDWLVELRRIGAGGDAAPRRATVQCEDLWRVLLRVAAPIDARAGAAVALAAAPEPGADLDARFAALAQGSACPELRAVLGAAAGGADAALLPALGAVATVRTG